MTDAELNDADWGRFRGQLARRLVTLKRDEFVEIHGASQRSHTTLIFTLTGSGRIRCAVYGMAPRAVLAAGGGVDRPCAGHSARQARVAAAAFGGVHPRVR